MGAPKGSGLLYTQEIADAICERVAEGSVSLRKASEEHGVSHSSVLRWAIEDPIFANQYARARDIGVEAEFDALNDLADEAPERGPDGKVDAGWVAWQKQRIDARKWGWARRAPKKYGDKVQTELTGPNGGAVQVEEVRRTVIDPKAIL